MKLSRLLYLTVFILFQSVFALAQDTLSLNSLIEKSQKVVQDYPYEKVYLHFDKPYYAVGDTIWFKAYVALGQDQPSDLSKVLYVDLISENDTLVRAMKLPIVNTSAYGSITLDPLAYKSGNYRIRAYTYWMINFSEDLFFTKNIPVGDAINRKIITNITLKGENPSNNPYINASIKFQDPDGTALANKKVNWQLISKFETIARGRETTDAMGKLALKLSASQKAALDTAVLETTLEADASRLITSTFPLKNAFADADLQFFPEGGDLIENLSTKIAFKAIQEKGLGIAVKGDIVDNSGKIISKIEAQHLGMGSFTLLPESGKTYSANLSFANGIKKTIALPAAKKSGITLSVLTTTPSNIMVQINANQAYFNAHQDQNYYLVARSKGIIAFAAQAALNTTNIGAAIPKSKFPDGIIQITVFNTKGEPLAERLVFLKHSNVSNLTLTSDKKIYGIRQPVKMNVLAKTRNLPVEGNFSISVYNETKVPSNEDDESSILSSFLISSELQGYIEKPNYYFHQINEKKIADLDLLMLTQGYRKFSYKDILAGKEPIINVLPEQGIEFSGVLRTSNGMPVSNGSLKLVVPESRFYAETKSNVRGEFKFENVNIPDSMEASISARSPNAAKNMMIMLNGTAFPTIAKNKNKRDEKLNIDSLLLPYLDHSKRQYRMVTQMLQEVVVTSTVIKKPSHVDHAALSGLPTVPDHLINADRFQGCTIFLSCLQASAVGLTYADNNFYVTRVYNTGLKVPVQIFLNGMPVEPSYLNSVQTADVDNVEIFLKDDLGLVSRTYNTNGILIINTKKAAKGTAVTAEDLRKLFPPSNVLTFNPQGYLKKREFYNPKYITAESKTKGADFRTTVYWNPRVFTDVNGTMAMEFYNSDNKGTYKAVVEGTDIEGNLSRFIYRYKVE
jgi:hypothetical protein